jgi:CheY-like chemotaxis protein
VVDNIAENRTVLVDMLAPLGFAMAPAQDGLEALAQSWSPDVVLMDIRMPDLDGLEATRRLRALPALSQVVIIAVSASAFVHHRDHYLASGANDFVPKPVQYAQLLEVLGSYLALEWAMEEVRHLATQLERRNQCIRETFGRYVTDDVVTSLLDSPEGLRLGGESAWSPL